MATGIISMQNATSFNSTLNGLTVRGNRVGRVTTITLFAGSTNSDVADEGTIATLPDGFAPAATVDFRDSFNSKRLRIDTSGKIISQGQSLPTGTTLRGTISYVN